MALRPLLDLDLLRTLVFLAEEGGFTRAAERVGRTQSAVTLQIQKLEAQLQQPLVNRSKGGPVELTAQGRALVERARTMLKLNDEVFRDFGEASATATVRFAASAGYAPFFLRRSIDAFRRSHPNAMVEVSEGNSCQIMPQWKDDAFDLIVCAGGHEPRDWPAREFWRGPLRWVISEGGAAHLRDPLPLSMVPKECPWRPAWMDDCYWRSAALRALQSAARPFQIVAASSSMDGLYAPVLAGEAVTVSLGAQLPAGLRAAGPGDGLPPLPDDRLMLVKGRNAPEPLTEALAEAIVASFSLD